MHSLLFLLVLVYNVTNESKPHIIFYLHVICIASATVGWSAVNFPNLEIRAVAVAVVVMVGCTGGVIASYIYPLSDGPYYRKLNRSFEDTYSNNKL